MKAVNNKLYILVMFLVAVACGKNNSNTVTPTPPDTTATSTTTFKNPLLPSGPDPWVIQKDGYYYYTQTLGNKIALWKTQHVDELKNATPVTVWNAVSGTDYSDDVWAPELHYTNSKWYIYFAADKDGDNSTHRLYVLENAAADPTTGSWTFKGKAAAATDKWAIDASTFEYKGSDYILWSGWQGNVDGEQDIFIAKLTNAWTINGERVMISKPTYTWETNSSPTVNEGPEAIMNAAGKLFLTFSAGGCWSDDYSLGLLTLKDGGDPLNAADWTKTPTPVFTKNIAGGAFGPGHNGFFKSPDGIEDWIIYHANANPGEGCGDARTPRIQKFTWNINGTPNFGSPVSINVLITKPSGE